MGINQIDVNAVNERTRAAAQLNDIKNKKKTSFEEERDKRIKENSILADAELA